jgi:hypothetical protein
MKNQKKSVPQSVTQRAKLKVLTGASLTEIKGGVAYDMVTSSPPHEPDDTTWG